MNSGHNNVNISGALVPILIGVTIALVIGGLIISTFAESAFPIQASAESQQIDQLFTVLLGIGGGLFLLVQGLLLFSIIRFRQKEGDEEDGPTIHGNVTLEIIWTAIPALVVLALVIYSYSVWVDIREPKDDALVVEAVGARFAWTFNYYEPRLDCESSEVDNRLDCEGRNVNPNISSPVLHTYVGRPVKMELETQDVIHSFWIPAMRIKQDLLPGRRTEIYFTPIESGEYRVVCTELCGSGHGDMVANIIVHDDEESYLTSFLDPAIENVVIPPDDPVEQGAILLASGAYPCAGCHVLQETIEEQGLTINWQGITGPSLEGIGDRAGGRVSGQSAEEYLYTSLYLPHSYLVPGYGPLMIQFQNDDAGVPNYMPSEDGQAVVAYLCTLTDIGESACDLENLEVYAESFNP